MIVMSLTRNTDCGCSRQVQEKIDHCFQDTLEKNCKLTYTMHFLTLFLTIYFEAKFDLVVMEKNEIY